MVALSRETHPRRSRRRPNYADHITVPAISICAGAEQRLPELIHQGRYHIQVRLKRVLRAEA
jgi:hypothetical protein